MSKLEFTGSLGRLFLEPVEDRLDFSSIGFDPSKLLEPIEFRSTLSDILSDNLSDILSDNLSEISLSDRPKLLADKDVRLLPPLDF